MVVKELLKFLVGEINAELFKTVELQGDNLMVRLTLRVMRINQDCKQHRYGSHSVDRFP